jgi:hypothetical protein
VKLAFHMITVTIKWQLVIQCQSLLMKPLLIVMWEKIGCLPGIALPAYGLMGAKCFAKF